MTLILSCLTARTVYQVSDRLIADWVDPARNREERNKAVLVAGRVSFGYTGRAEIAGERTDTWLARVISDGPTNNMGEVAERIRSAATVEFQKLRHIPKDYRRHAFQGVGWFRPNGRASLLPGVIAIHNCLDELNGGWLEQPFDEFRTATTQFPCSLPGGCRLDSVGIVPTAQERSAVVRLVRKCVKHRTSTPGTVLKALILSMRWLSARHSARVGNKLLAISLPQHAVEEYERSGRMALLAAPPNDWTATFAYSSPEATLTWFGPHIVNQGSVVTDTKVGWLNTQF